LPYCREVGRELTWPNGRVTPTVNCHTAQGTLGLLIPPEKVPEDDVTNEKQQHVRVQTFPDGSPDAMGQNKTRMLH
jgi:hypothetical protein